MLLIEKVELSGDSGLYIEPKLSIFLRSQHLDPGFTALHDRLSFLQLQRHPLPDINASIGPLPSMYAAANGQKAKAF